MVRHKAVLERYAALRCLCAPLQAYSAMKPSVVPTLFSRNIWSHGVALAATVGFKGVEIVMGS
eukprot:1387270-Prymnesium_polylepis.1